MFHSGGKKKKKCCDLIFILYMINYSIAPDYQKIVRDIIFHMYLISVHVEPVPWKAQTLHVFTGEISITRSC